MKAREKAESRGTGTGTEMGAVFARLFRGAEGELALSYLRSITIERRTGPEASEATLRHLEGQRHLVALVESLIARGQEG